MTETTQAPAIQQNFPLAKMDGDMSLADVITDNLGDDTLSPFDLERVTIPPGGVTTWSFEDGTEVKDIQGVIIKSQKTRSYWAEALSGEGNPPDCVSPDCITGYGEPGGDCATCPNNEFGTGQSGYSKACKETMHVFLLREDSLLPIVIQIPPSSLKAFKKYCTRLVGQMKSINSVVTSFTLEKGKGGKSGYTFSEVSFKNVGDLSKEHYEMVKQYRDGLTKIMDGGEMTSQQEQ